MLVNRYSFSHKIWSGRAADRKSTFVAVGVVMATMTLIALISAPGSVPHQSATSGTGGFQSEGITVSALAPQNTLWGRTAPGQGVLAAGLQTVGAVGSLNPLRGEIPPTAIGLRQGGVAPSVGRSGTVTIPVGSDPGALAVDTMNGDIYVTNSLSNNVSVISGSTDTLVGTIEVGSAPSALAVDTANGDVYVANTDSNNVSVVSGASNALVATIPVGDGPAFPASGDCGGYRNRYHLRGKLRLLDRDGYLRCNKCCGRDDSSGQRAGSSGGRLDEWGRLRCELRL